MPNEVEVERAKYELSSQIIKLRNGMKPEQQVLADEIIDQFIETLFNITQLTVDSLEHIRGRDVR